MLDSHFHMKVESDMIKKFMLVCKYKERSAGSITRELMKDYMQSVLDEIAREKRK